MIFFNKQNLADKDDNELLSLRCSNICLIVFVEIPISCITQAENEQKMQTWSFKSCQSIFCDISFTYVRMYENDINHETNILLNFLYIPAVSVDTNLS